MDYVYKVVKYHNNFFYSISVWHSPGARVEYAIGKVSVPRIPNSYLFGFSTLSSARNMAGWHNTIFLCETEIADVRLPDYIVRSANDVRYLPQIIRMYWTMVQKNDFTKIYRVQTYTKMFDTVLCKWIKPLYAVS